MWKIVNVPSQAGPAMKPWNEAHKNVRLWPSCFFLSDNVFVLASIMAPAAFAVVDTEHQLQMWV